MVVHAKRPHDAVCMLLRKMLEDSSMAAKRAAKKKTGRPGYKMSEIKVSLKLPRSTKDSLESRAWAKDMAPGEYIDWLMEQVPLTDAERERVMRRLGLD
jgi:hypothetical protein